MRSFTSNVISQQSSGDSGCVRDAELERLNSEFLAATPKVLSVLSMCEPDGILPIMLAFLGRAIDSLSDNSGADRLAHYSVEPRDYWTIYEALYVLGRRSKSYLEIGTRRGWSLMVACSGNQNLKCTCVDKWGCPTYAEEPNPGPAFVRHELRKVAPRATVRFVVENSQTILPRMRSRFDLVLVDGDHSIAGATSDIVDSWILLNKDGWLVCDDHNLLLVQGLDVRGVMRRLGAKTILWSQYGPGIVIAQKNCF